MRYEKAQKVNNLFKEINTLERRIELLEEFMGKSITCKRGELLCEAGDGSIYSFIFDGSIETNEIADLILSYYKEKIELLKDELEDM